METATELKCSCFVNGQASPCPSCQKYQAVRESGKGDLGWMNAGGDVEANIDRWAKRCRELSHHPSNTDIGGGYRGLDHHVVCEECGYEYHYDSSD